VVEDGSIDGTKEIVVDKFRASVDQKVILF
jgi:hypothetical protein